MDLNLHLGLPLSPRSVSVDLGSDLALNPLPISSSPSFEEMLMPFPASDALHPFDEIPNREWFSDSPNLISPYIPIPRSTNMPNMPNVPLILDDFPLPPLLPTITPSRRRELLDSEFTSRGGIARAHHNESSIGANSPTDPERLRRDIMSSRSLLGDIGKYRLGDEEKKLEKKSSSSAPDFECNICFELAEEPVVTSCGHLFCWPCLYRWLHRHCAYKECPLCKGEVVESGIVPIYGRGGSDSKGGGVLNLEIPPRPHGNRLESLRQSLQRPLLRRSDMFLDGRLLELVNDAHQRLQRLHEERSLRSLDRNTSENRQQHGEESQQQILMDRPPPRLSAIVAEIRGFLDGTDGGGVNSSAGGPRYREPLLSQASTSSTVAVMQGDNAAADALVEPNSGGQSTTLRRERSGASDISDFEQLLHPSQRRRSN